MMFDEQEALAATKIADLEQALTAERADLHTLIGEIMALVPSDYPQTVPDMQALTPIGQAVEMVRACVEALSAERERADDLDSDNRELVRQRREAQAERDAAIKRAERAEADANTERDRKPILFSGPMVQAILDGRKTQTRRVIKPQPVKQSEHAPWVWHRTAWRGMVQISDRSPVEFCPYGQPGGLLWVKETWFNSPTRYRANDDLNDIQVRWRPSIFMPRWASRIDLEILDVRVERVQDISASDAHAEGCYSYGPNGEPDDPREDFRDLWDSINAAPKPIKVGGRLDHYVSYPWEAINETRTHRGLPWLVMGNPWVWALTFRRTKP